MFKILVLFLGIVLATFIKYSPYNHILVFDVDIIVAALTGVVYMYLLLED